MKHLTDKQLLELTKVLVKKERTITAKILEHLNEIDKRRLYCDLGYSSLYNYCMNVLSYSEAQAFRRIDAMRLSRKVPIVKEKIDTGELSLTNANLLSDLFKKTDLEISEKNDVVEQASNATKNECQQMIESIKKEMGIVEKDKPEIVRKDGDEKVRLHVSLDKKVIEKLKKLKGLMAHEKNYSYEELIGLMADTLIEKVEGKKFISKRNTKSKGKKKHARYTDVI